MLTLFALVKDDADAITNDTLVRDLKHKLALAKEFAITTETLVFPRVTEVVMTKGNWSVRFEIRPESSRTLSVKELQKILGKKTQLPPDCQRYNKEIAVGFGGDPQKEHTNEIIFIGEFLRESYPGVVIFDQYNQDVW